jgi:hypothetical protein
MTPESFEGVFKLQKTSSFKFLETYDEDCESNSFAIYFYRRETEKYTIGEFLDSLSPENIGWDKPTKQLFYKDKDGKTYQLKFEELK